MEDKSRLKLSELLGLLDVLSVNALSLPIGDCLLIEFAVDSHLSLSFFKEQCAAASEIIILINIISDSLCNL